ncbi:hypothetical protein [Shinella sedimenti]|uniref:Uncharacterized protein n=1 Tax=Shinella sedimenti TaxID=2919913 RepID=A0ABT0CT17_9HYPH|nr:hypothetical protein [Shinella sedimenti]MCJ8151756.1 hypothetical protein [Shinella sedimenti]
MLRQLTLISIVAGIWSLPLGGVAQEISVPSVTTASPGYLFPNDQYQRKRQQQVRKARKADVPASQLKLDKAAHRRIQASIKALVPEYQRRAKRDGEVKANAWIRQQAFLLGQREAEKMKRRLRQNQ